MKPEHWQRVKTVVADALEIDRGTWPKWLAETCGDDVDIFLEASTLLAASRGLGSMFESSAPEMLGIVPARRGGKVVHF